MKECPNCHREIEDDLAFCGYCGTPLSVDMPKYLPGFEPENIKKSLALLFSEIDKVFPDKKIIQSEWDHERWDNAAKTLCKALGYKSGRAFFEAYGYIVVYAEASDSQENHMDNQASKERRERTEKQICSETRALKSEPIKQLKGNARFVVLGIIIVVLLMLGVLIISYFDYQSSKTSESLASYNTNQSNEIIVESNTGGYNYSKTSESPASYNTNQSNEIIVESNTEGYYYSITYEDFYAQMITAFSNATGIPENTISKQLQYAKPYSRNFEGYNNNVNLYRIKYDKDVSV